MNNTPVEVALALTQAESVEKLSGPSPVLSHCLQRLGCPMDRVNTPGPERRVTRLHFGNEFCERLMPTPNELEQVQLWAGQKALDLTLVTPMLTDAGFRRLDKLLPLLPDGSEVVINDWGVLRRLRADYPSLVPVLGRMLNKMIKDPRLPSEQWTHLQPHSSKSAHFQAFLKRFGIHRLEMDVPPFVRTEQFQTAPLGLYVHLPYGYTVKGRMCRIGSLGQRDEGKFVAGHACRKECLTYWVKTERPGAKSGNELYSFQRGNSQFYRHSDRMAAALWQAVDHHWIRRLIFAGDWHENYHPAE